MEHLAAGPGPHAVMFPVLSFLGSAVCVLMEVWSYADSLPTPARQQSWSQVMTHFYLMLFILMFLRI